MFLFESYPGPAFLLACTIWPLSCLSDTCVLYSCFLFFACQIKTVCLSQTLDCDDLVTAWDRGTSEPHGRRMCLMAARDALELSKLLDFQPLVPRAPRGFFGRKTDSSRYHLTITLFFFCLSLRRQRTPNAKDVPSNTCPLLRGGTLLVGGRIFLRRHLDVASVESAPATGAGKKRQTTQEPVPAAIVSA